MPDYSIVTVVTRNYLHFVRALAASVRRVHPDAAIITCLVDEPAAGWQREKEPFQVVFARELGIKNRNRFLFQYSPMELTCALKSYFLLHILKTTTFQKLLYLDADIQVYGSLTPLLEILENYNIVLTPHLTRPKSLAAPDRWEVDILDTGIFNGGFVGIRKTEISLSVLEWWRQRVEKWCKQDIYHLDQKWFNGVPVLFDGVYIERGTQFNAAPWNTADRLFTENSQGQITVDGQPLVFFHFASIEPSQSETLSRISRRPLREEPRPVQRLFHEYAGLLQECGMEECHSWGYQHSCLGDGRQIRPEWRELIRTDHPKFSGVENPFKVPASNYRRAALVNKIKRRGRRILRGLSLD